MTRAWIQQRLSIIAGFSTLVFILHWIISRLFDFTSVFQSAIVIHIFLFFITAFVFVLARKINDHHPDYTTEVMLGANVAKMLLVISFFTVVYLLKEDNVNFAYSFLAIYFLYLPFNVVLYLKFFKLPSQMK